jgi:hypothetical protein
LNNRNPAPIVLAVPASPTLRASLIATGTVILLILALLAWKGISLWALSSRIDAQARDIGVLYRETITQDAGTLAAHPGLTPDQKQAAQLLTQLKLNETQPVGDVLTTVVAMQQACMRLFDSAQIGDALTKDPQFVALQKHLGKQGTAAKRIEPYNRNVQAWNNQQDDWLGSWYFRFFRLQPRQLLNPNGTVEYETKVSI